MIAARYFVIEADDVQALVKEIVPLLAVVWLACGREESRSAYRERMAWGCAVCAFVSGGATLAEWYMRRNEEVTALLSLGVAHVIVFLLGSAAVLYARGRACGDTGKKAG